MIRELRILILVGFALTGLQHAAAASTIYEIDYDGAQIDVTGFIQTDAVGTFTPAEFDSLVIDYSIHASINGANPYTFTPANSTWGGLTEGFPTGQHVTIGVTASLFQLSAPTGGPFDAGNLFLIANSVTESNQENLLLYENQFGYLPGAADRVYDTVSTPFVFAQAVQQQPVPEPTTLLLLGSGLAGAVVRSRMRKRGSVRG